MTLGDGHKCEYTNLCNSKLSIFWIVFIIYYYLLFLNTTSVLLLLQATSINIWDTPVTLEAHKIFVLTIILFNGYFDKLLFILLTFSKVAMYN